MRSDSRQVLDIVLAAKSAVQSSAASGAAPPSEISLAAGEPAKPRSRALRVVTWTALAGAVAAGAVAGTFLIIRSGQKSDFDKYNNLVGDASTPPADIPTYNSKRAADSNDVNRSKWIAVGCGIGAGALAVTALVTYLLDSDGEESKSKTAVSVSPFGLGVTF